LRRFDSANKVKRTNRTAQMSLLSQPQTADVRALETCQFQVANVIALLRQNLIAVLRGSNSSDRMSALCQKRTHAVQQLGSLFDHPADVPRCQGGERSDADDVTLLIVD
jgi:hypothetical protein